MELAGLRGHPGRGLVQEAPRVELLTVEQDTSVDALDAHASAPYVLSPSFGPASLASRALEVFARRLQSRLETPNALVTPLKVLLQNPSDSVESNGSNLELVTSGEVV